MVKSLLAIVSASMIISAAGHMYYEDEAISVYGYKKKHGRDCLYLDLSLTMHEYHISENSLGYGIHGCPIFTAIRR